MTGLVLTAGGARGAYQAGVLKRIGEIRAFRGRPSPFAIVAGASAGAINGVAVAAGSESFSDTAQLLGRLWSRLTVADVIRTDLLSLAGIGRRLLLDVLLGHFVGAGRTQSIFDATPLRAFLAQNLAVNGIEDSIRAGHLYAVAVTATSYHSGKSFTFVQGRTGHPLWTKSRRVTLAARITVDHVCASAAIPIVFPPVALRCDGATLHFGDGGLRLVTPLSPAIRLGASRILAVGVRCQGSADELTRAERVSGAASGDGNAEVDPPPLSQICGVFLNAIFLDHLDADLDHLKRMNELVRKYDRVSAVRSAKDAPEPAAAEPMRMIEALTVNPSEDLAIIAKSHAHRMPRVIRFFLDALGTPDAQSADLMSYLLFDSAFTRELVDVGYRDAGARIDEIEAFLRTARPIGPFGRKIQKKRARLYQRA